MSFVLKMMIAAYLPDPDEYREQGQWWFSAVADKLFGDDFGTFRVAAQTGIAGGYVAGTKLRIGSYQFDDGILDALEIPYSEGWISDLAQVLTRRAGAVSLMTGQFAGNDRIYACDAEMTTLSVGHGEFARDSGWVSFSAVIISEVSDPARRIEIYEHWTDFLAVSMPRLGGDYGQIARHRKSHQYSALETEIRMPSTSKRTRVLGGYCLRGYEWVTACGPAVAQRLGGEKALRESGAFERVQPLGHGGLLFRATPTIEDLDEPTLRRIYPVLAPVLIPGTPTVHPRASKFKGGHIPVIYGVDAADFGSSVPPELDPDGLGMGAGY
ncbi:hypothetical protein ACFQS3_08290 [Glycomyces mayteni]|uniref:Uncharacterized protein n=1 Tax=Glycomyces mayteni TaxID=543887 RepID=A0ABW2D4W6_9ACTN|nr:hypothetical protein GCM10025732_25870 [Glycomyces mayteni]